MSVISKSPPPPTKKTQTCQSKTHSFNDFKYRNITFQKNYRYIIIEHNRKSKYILLEN